MKPLGDYKAGPGGMPGAPNQPGEAPDVLQSPEASNALRSLLGQHFREPSVERAYQCRNGRLNDLYYNGTQYMESYLRAANLMPSVGNGLITNGPSIGSYASVDEFMDDYVFPIFRADVHALISVIGPKAPALKGVPVVNGDQGQTQRARIADKYNNYFRKLIPADELQGTLVRMACLEGTVFGHQFWRGDRHLVGDPPVRYRSATPAQFLCPACQTQTPVSAGAQGACPQCGSPLTQANYQPGSPGVELPQSPAIGVGAVGMELASAAAVDVPAYTKDLTTADRLVYEYYESKWELIDRYRDFNPEILSWMNQGPLGNSFLSQGGIMPRPRVGGYSGGLVLPSSHQNLWLHTQTWLHPRCYAGIENDQSGNIRGALSERFPQGARIVFLNNNYVGLFHERLSAHWTMCKTAPVEGPYSSPIFDDYRNGIDILNDTLNLIIEAIQASVSELAYDTTVIDRRALADRIPSALNVIPCNSTARGLAEHFFRIPGATVDEALWNFANAYLDRLREMIGITPSLFGGGAVEKTARGAELRRAQALTRHTVFYGFTGRFWAEAISNAARISAANLGDQAGTVYLESRSGTPETVQIPQLNSVLEGGWGYMADDQVPSSPGMRREWVSETLAQPQLSLALSLTDEMGKPRIQNIRAVREVVPFEDWHVAGEAEYDRLEGIVAKLLVEQPIMGAVDPMTGIPIMSPAIPPDTLLFPDPVVPIEFLRTWLLESEEIEETNGPGFQHVRSYLESWMNVQMEMQMAQMAQMGDPGMGGEAEGSGAPAGSGGGGMGTGGGGGAPDIGAEEIGPSLQLSEALAAQGEAAAGAM